MQDQPVQFCLGGLGLILFGTAVLVALRLVFTSRRSPHDDPLHTVLTVAGRVMIVFGLLGVFLIVLTFFGVLVVIAAVVVLHEALVRRRLVQQRALLWALAVAAGRRIPLVATVEAFARERGGILAERARGLADDLRAGVPLPDALQKSRRLLPPGALPVIQVGCRSGAMAEALRRAASAGDARDRLWHSLAGRLAYLCMLLVFGVLILTFVILNIIPKFQDIFTDFDAQLPAITQLLISVSAWAGDHWYVLFALNIMIFLLLGYAALRDLGWTGLELPGEGRLTRRLSAAAILEALALAAEHRRPLSEGIATLAQWFPKSTVRWRLYRALTQLEAGGDWCQCLAAEGLITRPDAAILRAAQRVGNLPWAMREMAESNRRRLAYRLHALVQLLFPPVVIAAGAVVMFVVVALFVPLIALISKLV